MRLLDWVLIGITALLCGVSFWLMLTDLKAYRLANPPAEEEEAPKVLNKWVILYSAVMIVLTLGVAVAFGILYQANSFCFSLKRLSLLAVMWPLALIDAKTYRIPNRFILFGLICWAGIFVTELFVQYDGIWRRLLSEGIAAAALLLASMLCRLCAKNSIGYGDMGRGICLAGPLLPAGSVPSRNKKEIEKRCDPLRPGDRPGDVCVRLFDRNVRRQE